jgi:hypothetical protein
MSLMSAAEGPKTRRGGRNNPFEHVLNVRNCDIRNGCMLRKPKHAFWRASRAL